MQGDLGEVSALQWLGYQGAKLAVPFGHSPDWDLIAEMNGRLLRVQVKTSRSMSDGRWNVAICTRGGNQSWNGITKRLDSSRCDYLFAAVADGRRWFIPAGALRAATVIRLGGPRYAEFEVDRGPPLIAPNSANRASTLSNP